MTEDLLVLINENRFSFPPLTLTGQLRPGDASSSLTLKDSSGDVVLSADASNLTYLHSSSRHTFQWSDGSVVLAVGVADVTDFNDQIVAMSAIELQPPQVNSLTLKLSDDADKVFSAGESAKLQSGKNMQLSADGPSQFSIAAIASYSPDYSDCDELDTVISKVNQVTTDAGRVYLDATECFRYRPHIEYHPDDTATIVDGQLVVRDDCKPCCDCGDYLKVYRAMERISRKSQIDGEILAAESEIYSQALRDAADFIDTYNTPATVRLRSLGNCHAAVIASYSNQTPYPVEDVTLTITFSRDDDGGWQDIEAMQLPLTFHLYEDTLLRQIPPLSEESDGTVKIALGDVGAGEVISGVFSVYLNSNSRIRACVEVDGDPDLEPHCAVKTHNCTVLVTETTT